MKVDRDGVNDLLDALDYAIKERGADDELLYLDGDSLIEYETQLNRWTKLHADIVAMTERYTQ